MINYDDVGQYFDLSNIPDGSMRMFIQSPPYFQLREYRNQPDYFIHGQEETLADYIKNEVKFYQGAKRKLLPNGVIVIIIGETYRDGYQGVCTKLETALEKDGWYILDVNTFVKTNAKATPHVARFLNSKETIIVAGLKPANETLFNDVTRPSSIGEFKVIPGSSRATGGKGYSMASPESSHAAPKSHDLVHVDLCVSHHRCLKHDMLSHPMRNPDFIILCAFARAASCLNERNEHFSP